MSPVDDPLPALLAHWTISDDRSGMPHDDPTGEHHDLDGLAHQAPGHRVAVGIEIARAVRSNLADQVAQLTERSAAAERAQGADFSGEAHDRRLARRAVNARVGDLPVPLLDVEPVKIRYYRRAEDTILVTPEFTDWCSRHGASFKWIALGDPKALAETHRTQALQTMEFRELVENLSEKEKRGLTLAMHATVKHGVPIKDALAMFERSLLSGD